MSIAAELSQARQVLLDEGRQPPRALRAAVLQLYEGWLTARAAALGMGANSGMALIAVGGLGRRELLPHSDLDLVLVHGGLDPSELSTVADGLWYPLWDAHVKLDHSVRTPAQALAVATDDLTAALGLLESRHIAGDVAVSSQVIGPVRQQWRASIDRRLRELTQQAALRWERSGEIAHRAEPDLKHGRGGLRDLQLLEALALAQVTNRTPGLAQRTPGGGLIEARTLLLDVRTELHVVTGRAHDILRAQDADEVADALGLGDRFVLARALSDAARTVSYSVEVGLRTARASLPRRGLAGLRRRPLRRPLADDVVEHAGQVSLARGARPSADRGLVLRVALASARTGLPISGATLSTLAGAPTDHAAVWPKPMREEFLALLGTGRSVIAAIEALDRVGLWCSLLPEWAGVRDLPARDSAHVWSVDRHLMETCAYAGALSSRVTRPDLLVLGALVHDIGKGRPGDHCVSGAKLAEQIGTRLGLPPGDTTTLSAMVRYHLLLPITATRRDLDDPATVAAVVKAVDGDGILLELLHALAEVDSLATGPGVWGTWKASLIDELVTRCRLLTRGEPLPTPEAVAAEHLALAATGGLHVIVAPASPGRTMVVTVIAPDGPGVLARAAGVLALHSLNVHSASVRSAGAAVVDSFAVSPRFGSPPEAGLLRQDLTRALVDDAELARRLTAKEAAYGQPGSGAARVLWVDTPGDLAVLELRAADRAGLLYRVTSALQHNGVQIAWARVETLGSAVVDAFGLALGAPDTAQRRAAVETAVLRAVAARSS